MYDDLARTQHLPPLEWFVVHAVIPSVLLTFALQNHSTVQRAPQRPAYTEFVWLPVIDGPWMGGPVSDRFPSLIWMPRAVYPTAMVRVGIEGYVRLKALVDTRGRVVRSSVLVLHATDSRFVEPARAALADAVFRPESAGGPRMEYWVTMTIEFRARFRG
jgi:TonB family protein